MIWAWCAPTNPESPTVSPVSADTLHEPEKLQKWHNGETVWGQNPTLTQTRRTMHSVLFGRRPHQISGVLDELGGFLFPKTEILWPVMSLDPGAGFCGDAWSNGQTLDTLWWTRIHLVILIKTHQCNHAELAGLAVLTQRPWVICCWPEHRGRLETATWPQLATEEGGVNCAPKLRPGSLVAEWVGEGSSDGLFEMDAWAGHEADTASEGMYGETRSYSSREGAGGEEWMLICVYIWTCVCECV